MERPSFSSVTDQVAEALREGIRQGRWSDAMPGRGALARELGVNHKTAEAALKTLEKAGCRAPARAGKSHGGKRLHPRH